MTQTLASNHFHRALSPLRSSSFSHRRPTMAAGAPGVSGVRAPGLVGAGCSWPSACATIRHLATMAATVRAREPSIGPATSLRVPYQVSVAAWAWIQANVRVQSYNPSIISNLSNGTSLQIRISGRSSVRCATAHRRTRKGWRPLSNGCLSTQESSLKTSASWPAELKERATM